MISCLDAIDWLKTAAAWRRKLRKARVVLTHIHRGFVLLTIACRRCGWSGWYRVIILRGVRDCRGDRRGLWRGGSRRCRRLACAWVASMALVRCLRGRGGGLIPALAHGRLDIGDFESGFVETHGGVSGSVIHCDTFDARHLANPLLHILHAQHREHVVHFNNTRLHRASSVNPSIQDKVNG